jgi:hypothetical protein
MAGLLGGCAAPQPNAAPRQSPELIGRVAGTPQRCLSINQFSGLRVSGGDRHTVLSGGGKEVWGNDLGPSCGFGVNDVLVLEPTSSQYCRGDLVRSIDRYSKIQGPTCVLGDFVPYSRL